MTERLFFALWPDPAARQAFQALLGGLPHHGGREPHPEDLHLTLVFLGECGPGARTCAEAVAGGIRGRGFDLGFDQVGYWSRPQILWCAPSQIPEALLTLVAALNQGLRRCGFEPERRPYAPHLTLARRAHPVAPYRLATPLPWPAREFVLVRSDPQSLPHYRVVGRWPLEAPEPGS
jgi:2'-5' RNA ligase